MKQISNQNKNYSLCISFWKWEIQVIELSTLSSISSRFTCFLEIKVKSPELSNKLFQTKKSDKFNTSTEKLSKKKKNTLSISIQTHTNTYIYIPSAIANLYNKTMRRKNTEMKKKTTTIVASLWVFLVVFTVQLYKSQNQLYLSHSIVVR